MDAPSSQSGSPCPAGLRKLPHIPLEGFRFGLKLEKVHTPSRMRPTDLNPNQRWGDSWPGRTPRCIWWLQADFFFLSFPLRDEAVFPGGQGKPCAPRGPASLPKPPLPSLSALPAPRFDPQRDLSTCLTSSSKLEKGCFPQLTVLVSGAKQSFKS